MNKNRLTKSKSKTKSKLSSYQRRKQEIFELQIQTQKLNKLLHISKNVISEMHLRTLLEKIMENVTVVMNADRSSLFLIDHKTNECCSVIAQGANEIRFPIGKGLAGHVALTGESINITEAYKDDRFNPSFDRQTGYKTQSILTMPLKAGTENIVGVTQVLNKIDGTPFTEQDENLLAAFSSLAAIAIQNAQLYEQVLDAKNYNESILTNIHNAVLTLNTEGQIITSNDAAYRIFETSSEKLSNQHYVDFFQEANQTIIKAIEKAMKFGKMVQLFDVEYLTAEKKVSNINLNVKSLINVKGDNIGLIMVVEDITKEKRMKSTLSQYMTKEVAEQVLNNQISLKGKREKVTILFSDIRNFTSLSERSQPEEIVELLNDYFDIMIDIIFKHEGTLDKFIGDAIMALFGAPIKHHDDAHRAVKTAIDMIKALNRFNQDRHNRGLFPIEIGIGLNSGEVLAGNVGSEKRMEYTVIGDAVNLASRLESLTKQFPHQIIISEFVYEEVKNDFEFDYLDEVNVKGKDIPVKIYGVQDIHFYQ